MKFVETFLPTIQLPANIMALITKTTFLPAFKRELDTRRRGEVYVGWLGHTNDLSFMNKALMNEQIRKFADIGITLKESKVVSWEGYKLTFLWFNPETENEAEFERLCDQYGVTTLDPMSAFVAQVMITAFTYVKIEKV